MFKGIAKLMRDTKVRAEFYVARAVVALFDGNATIEAEAATIGAEAKERLAEAARIRAAAAAMNAESAERALRLERDKVQAFNELARNIEQLPDPVDREELMDSLKMSSMGQAAFRRYH